MTRESAYQTGRSRGAAFVDDDPDDGQVERLVLFRATFDDDKWSDFFAITEPLEIYRVLGTNIGGRPLASEQDVKGFWKNCVPVLMDIELSYSGDPAREFARGFAEGALEAWNQRPE
jgi:hypothetical protein